MKGNIKITITECDKVGAFPITNSWTYERDNTFEEIEEYIDIFRGFLLAKGFHSDLVEQFIPKG